MQIGRLDPTAKTGPVNRTAPAAAAAPAKPTPSQSLQAGNHLASAPGASATKQSALDVVPKDWVPMGHSEPKFNAKLGPMTVLSGTAKVDRNENQASIKTPQANFTLRNDPKNPNAIDAVTPQGTYTGTAQRKGNELDFKANDGKHGLTIKKSDKELRVDTQGFGPLDHGHLDVASG